MSKQLATAKKQSFGRHQLREGGRTLDPNGSTPPNLKILALAPPPTPVRQICLLPIRVGLLGQAAGNNREMRNIFTKVSRQKVSWDLLIRKCAMLLKNEVTPPLG